MSADEGTPLLNEVSSETDVEEYSRSNLYDQFCRLTGVPLFTVSVLHSPGEWFGRC